MFATAVAISSVNWLSRDSVSGGKGSSRVVAATMVPHRRPSTSDRRGHNPANLGPAHGVGDRAACRSVVVDPRWAPCAEDPGSGVLAAKRLARADGHDLAGRTGGGDDERRLVVLVAQHPNLLGAEQ